MPGNRRGHRHAAHLAAERAPQGLDGALSPICHGNLRNAHVIARAAHALGKPHFDLRTRGAPLERIDGEHHIEGAPHPTLARRGRQAMGAHGRTAYGRGSFHRGRRGRFPAIAAQSALQGLQARNVMRALDPLLAMRTPQPAEERTQFRSALVFQNARGNRECMVQARVGTHVVERSERAALGVGRTVYAPVDARVDHEARAHETRLERDVDGAATQAPSSKRARRLHHGEELGVRRGVFVQLAPIVGSGDDRTLVHHDCADRHLADLGGGTRLGERLTHEAFVVFTRHR